MAPRRLDAMLAVLPRSAPELAQGGAHGWTIGQDVQAVTAPPAFDEAGLDGRTNAVAALAGARGRGRRGLLLWSRASRLPASV